MIMTAEKSTSAGGRGLMPSISSFSHFLSSFWLGLLLLSVVSVADQSGSTTKSESVTENANAHSNFGVDASWPMQHAIGNEQYEKFMDGCYRQGYANYEKRVDGLYQRKKENEGKMKIGKEYYVACNHAEQDRLQMNLNQPKEMQNYTHAGYAKVNTPSKVVDLLKNFWEKNERYLWPEFWNDGNTYVNHWKVPTALLDIGRKDLPYSFTTQEYDIIIQSIQDVLESWTNQRLVLTSAYGIRVYGEGAILAPHVDRLPLVSSAIINVFQRNVTEPWMLEVIGHDGMAHNLTANPRDMILYESASIIHGRPYPLKGKGATYGSLFVHFEPLFHTLRHAQNAGDHYAGTNGKNRNDESKKAFEKALEDQLKKPSLKDLVDSVDEDGKVNIGNADTSKPVTFRKTPDYVWPEYDHLYDQRFYFEYNENVYPKTFKSVFGNLNSHQAASTGELNALKEIARAQGRSELFKADHNGWKPLHEAARGGHADVVEYLLNEGAKVNERTNFNEGGNALYWAQKDPKKCAKAIAVLEKHGGVVVAPLDKKKENDAVKDVKQKEKEKADEKEKTKN
jgi:prolyl 4-hydroxylase